MIESRKGFARRLALTLAAALALLAVPTGCGGLKSALGLGKSSPDEFAVVRHAGLAVPPNFDLRPPEPGAARPQAISPREDARKAVVGEQPQAATAAGATGLARRTPGESALLRQSGAQDSPRNIREVVRIEAAAIGHQDRTFTDALLFWKDTDEAEGEILDPVAEAERLKAEKEGTAPAAEGEVVIKRKKTGLFGNLF